MDKTSLVLTGLITVAFALMLAPSVFAMNRGKVLRNIALWLLIFLGLGLVYQNFGPGKTHSLSSMISNEKTDANGEQTGADQGYIPPKED
jgi:hypothetical protein